jgi:hypothetical protein
MLQIPILANDFDMTASFSCLSTRTLSVKKPPQEAEAAMFVNPLDTEMMNKKEAPVK